MEVKINSNQSLSISYKDEDKKVSTTSVTSLTSTRILKEIKSIKALAGTQMPKEVWIVGDNNAGQKTFKTLIAALKEMKIYKYKLITSPE